MGGAIILEPETAAMCVAAGFEPAAVHEVAMQTMFDGNASATPAADPQPNAGRLDAFDCCRVVKYWRMPDVIAVVLEPWEPGGRSVVVSIAGERHLIRRDGLDLAVRCDGKPIHGVELLVEYSEHAYAEYSAARQVRETAIHAAIEAEKLDKELKRWRQV